jgi:hypothetical protein
MNPARACFGLAPGGYVAHRLHDANRDWPETNCYVDVWIELLATLGVAVDACLGFTIASDFEGDQWTFFKPPFADLEALYGIRVEELTLWRPLVEHVVVQVERGNVPLVEVDSYFLPDTCGTAYQQQHEKTTIGIVAIDAATSRLRYFHNRGLHELHGADFAALLRIDPPPGDGQLPPYCEIVKLAHLVQRSEVELRARALDLARRHFALRPLENPVRRYEQGFDAHLALLSSGDLAVYHAYGFAAVRQLGAGFELLASHLHWLDAGRGDAFAHAAEAFAALSAAAKTFLLKLARIANAGRARDVSSSFAEMAQQWERGMDRLGEALAR